MKCRRVEKLLPLYVEGDVEPRLAGRIASHLDWCGRCNWLADEYKESQNWLHSRQVPEFDETQLGDLKREVLIQVGGLRPSLFASLVQHWSRRQVLALSGALLIVLGVLLFYIQQSNRNAAQPVSELAKENPAEAPERRFESAGGPPANRRLVPPRVPKLHSYLKRRNENHSIARQNLDRSHYARAAQVSSRATQTSYSFGDSRDMLRIEIQTGDPNIRIIWFAPKEPVKSNPATD
ncbi:MAG: zf-HC2 domain-containing protein [Blastocatellia bacterium]